MIDDTPLYHALLEETASARHLSGTLVRAIYADHEEQHEGPIKWCPSRACRVAWAGRKAA